MAVFELLCQRRVMLVPQVDGLGVHGFLYIAFVTGEDHHHPVKAQLFGGFEGDGVRNAAIQIQLAADLHRLGHEGHGGGGPDHVHLGHGVFQTDIFRLAGLHIRYHRPEGDAGGVKGVAVKGVQFPGYLFVGVFRIHDVAGFQQGDQPHVMMVGIEALIVADHPSWLPGEVIHAEGGPGGHADDAVELDPGVVENV